MNIINHMIKPQVLQHGFKTYPIEDDQNRFQLHHDDVELIDVVYVKELSFIYRSMSLLIKKILFIVEGFSDMFKRAFRSTCVVLSLTMLNATTLLQEATYLGAHTPPWLYLWYFISIVAWTSCSYQGSTPCSSSKS